MTDTDQSDVLAFLANSRTHDLLFPIVRIDTHTAVVFLAGLDVYKVKRAVRFPFLDQSTLDLRRQACEAEVAVNRRYAAELYHGVVPITRTTASLAIAGDGEPVEWAVHMRRFDETRTLDHVAERGELVPPLVVHLVQILLGVYASAEVRDGMAATAALRGVLDETLASVAAAVPLVPEHATVELALRIKPEFDRLEPLLLERGRHGRARRCHGDLHLRNIALLNGMPTPFDAIEFDESIATIDVLYDFAFLLMDLWEKGLPSQANLALNRYLWGVPDLPGELRGLAMLPTLMSLRAAVRAKVEALRGGDASAEARRYLALACDLMEEQPAQLVAIGGFSGTGKSTVAAYVAPRLGRTPGAVHLRSDIERKRIFGIAEQARLPQEAYTKAMSDRVFSSLCEQARTTLAAGQSVVLDAVHRRLEEREMITDVAAAAGMPFTGIWLETTIETALERVEARRGDASDATTDVVRRQAAEITGPIAWQRIDASGSLDEVVHAVSAVAVS